MNRTLIRQAVAAACCLVAAAALAQSKHNPTGDPDVEKGYQKHQQEQRERQQKAQQSQTPKESTGTNKQEGTYGKDWQEEQLGTKGKVRTW